MRAQRIGVAIAFVFVTTASCSLFVSLDGLGDGAVSSNGDGGGDSSSGKDGSAGADSSALLDAGADGGEGYAAAVLGDHPLAYFHLDETSGTTIVDSSGNGHDATIHQNVVLGGAGAFAGSGSSAHFDGNSYIAIDDSVNDAGTVFDFDEIAPFTLEAWVNLDELAVSGSTELTFFSKEKDLGSGNFNGIDFFSRPEVKMQREDDPVNETEAVAPNALEVAKTWYYLVATYDGDHITIYVNGINVGTAGSPTMILNVSVPFLLGAEDTNAGSALLGSMDEAAIYDKELSLPQILAHYHAGGGS